MFKGFLFLWYKEVYGGCFLMGNYLGSVIGTIFLFTFLNYIGYTLEIDYALACFVVSAYQTYKTLDQPLTMVTWVDEIKTTKAQALFDEIYNDKLIQNHYVIILVSAIIFVLSLALIVFLPFTVMLIPTAGTCIFFNAIDIKNIFDEKYADRVLNIVEEKEFS